jgi:Uma2 family endonuclease
MTVANIHTIKMTAEQYLQLGEDPPGVRLELINGEIIVSPSAVPQHSRVIMKLTRILLNHIEPRKLGEIFGDTDVPFEKHTVRRPDMCFYAAAHLHRVSPKRLESPPDLCVEVLSPDSVDDDRVNKFELYRAHGVLHYWIIDPAEQTAECFALESGKYRLAARGKDEDVVHFPPFGELGIDLAELWMPSA